MANKLYYSKEVLTGGAVNALDYIDGDLLTDGDFAFVTVSGVMYAYKLNGSSSAAESSPLVIAPDTNPGTKRWELQGMPQLVVGSDADGDMYYRASGLLARLAKGAANTKLFMNAAGTAPEWATGHSHVSTSYDVSLTTDLAIAGAGFKPSLAVIRMAMNNSGVASFGSTTATAAGCIWFHSGNILGVVGQSGQPLWGQVDASASFYTAFKSFDADGMTMTRTKGNSPTGTALLEIDFYR